MPTGIKALKESLWQESKEMEWGSSIMYSLQGSGQSLTVPLHKSVKALEGM